MGGRARGYNNNMWAGDRQARPQGVPGSVLKRNGVGSGRKEDKPKRRAPNREGQTGGRARARSGQTGRQARNYVTESRGMDVAFRTSQLGSRHHELDRRMVVPGRVLPREVRMECTQGG